MLFYKQKELFTGEGCVEMDNPWQLCRTIGPLLRDSPWQVLKHSQGGGGCSAKMQSGGFSTFGFQKYIEACQTHPALVKRYHVVQMFC